jgi:ABC-type transport system involved in Fe-S cluster assembly fused permease/ATPase subunit
MGVLSPASITEKVVAAVKSTTSLSLLNSGQAMIIALGTLFVMLLAVPAFLRHSVRCALLLTLDWRRASELRTAK